VVITRWVVLAHQLLGAGRLKTDNQLVCVAIVVDQYGWAARISRFLGD